MDGDEALRKERRASLEIDAIEPRKRPWSARRQVHVMKTIPESKQHATSIDRHEIRQFWSTSFDPRNPASNVADGSSATFWVSSGLYPQLIGCTFRRPIALWKVLVYCTGVRSLRLLWRQADLWADQRQTAQDSTEFVFCLGALKSATATAVQLEVLDGADFAIVRHLAFVEHASRSFDDDAALDLRESPVGEGPPCGQRRRSLDTTY